MKEHEVVIDEFDGNSEEGEGIEKRYINQCDVCGFQVEAYRKYAVLQSMKRHRETCCGARMSKTSLKLSCIKCDFKAQDSMIMRRHMRDIHDSASVSTSPPPKKQRKSTVESKENDDEDMDFEEEKVHDLSLKLEDMEIENKEEDEYKERSEMVDRKIKAKKEENKRKEISEKIKQIELDQKKQMEKER